MNTDWRQAYATAFGLAILLAAIRLVAELINRL